MGAFLDVIELSNREFKVGDTVKYLVMNSHSSRYVRSMEFQVSEVLENDVKLSRFTPPNSRSIQVAVDSSRILSYEKHVE